MLVYQRVCVGVFFLYTSDNAVDHQRWRRVAIFCRSFGARFSGMATTKTGHSTIPWGYSLVN